MLSEKIYNSNYKIIYSDIVFLDVEMPNGTGLISSKADLENSRPNLFGKYPGHYQL